MGVSYGHGGTGRAPALAMAWGKLRPWWRSAGQLRQEEGDLALESSSVAAMDEEELGKGAVKTSGTLTRAVWNGERAVDERDGG